MMRFAIQFIALLAFTLSGISPACAFISGKSSSIEICTADGIKTINLPADKAPEEKKSHGHQKKNDCAFCFAQTHLKSAKGDAANLALPRTVLTDKISLTASAQRQHSARTAHSPRAPPLFA